MASAGTAYVRIQPDFTRFNAEMNSRIGALEAKGINMRVNEHGLTSATGNMSKYSQAANDAALATARGTKAAEGHVGAMTKLGHGLTGAGNAMQATGRKASALGSDIQKIGTPIAAVAAGAVFLQMKFQGAMEQVHTQAGYSQAAVEKLSKSVLAVAPDLARTPEELAQGLYHIASVGIPAAKAMDVLRAAAEGANISGASFDDTANAVVTTLRNFPNTAGGAKAVMAELNAIVGAGNMRMQDLVVQLGKVVPAAKAFGLTLNDVGGGLDVMTSHGMTAGQAATALKMAISTMGAPSAIAAQELKKIGLTSTQLADDMRKPNGMLRAVADLANHLQHAGLTATEQAQVLSRAFGGGRTGAGVMLLTQNVGDLSRILGKLPQGTAAVKALDAAQAAWEKTSEGQFAHLKATLATVGVQIGASLSPIVVPLFKNVSSIIRTVAHDFEGLPKGVKQFALALAGLAVVAGPVLKIVAGLSGLAGGAIKALGGLGGALGGHGGALSSVVGSTKPVPVYVMNPGFGGVAGGAGTAAAVAGGRGAAIAGLSTVALGAAAAVAAAIMLKNQFNKPVNLPAGSTPKQVVAAMDLRGIPKTAQVEILLKLKQQGAFSPQNIAKSAVDRVYGTWNQEIQKRKFWDFSSLTKSINTQMGKVPQLLRGQMGAAMVATARELERSGRLPAGAAAKVAQDIMRRYHVLIPGLGATARSSQKQIQAAFERHDVINAAEKQRKDLEKTYSNFPKLAQTTGKNMADNWVKEMVFLETQTHSRNKATADQAKKDLGRMPADAKASAEKVVAQFGGMEKGVEKQVSKMSKAIQSGSKSAAVGAGQTFGKFAQSIGDAMSAGVIGVQQGNKMINDALNATLQSFGAATVPGVVSVTSGSVTAAVGSLVKAMPFHAGGGYIGRPGEKGRDEVPIVVGRGEAVLNHSQQQVVNRALQATGFGGGLNQVFGQVTTPHYMPTGDTDGLQGFAIGGAPGLGFVSPGGLGHNQGAPRPSVTAQHIASSHVAAPGFPAPVGAARSTANAALIAAQALFHFNPNKTGGWGPGGEWLGSTVGGLPSQNAGGLLPPTQQELGFLLTMASTGNASTQATAIKQLVALGAEYPASRSSSIYQSLRNSAVKAILGGGGSLSGGQLPGPKGVGSKAGAVSNEIAQFMSAHGFNKIAIAGMLGNAVQESGIDPNAPGGGVWQQISNFGGGTGGSLLNQMQTMLPQIRGLTAAMNAAKTPGEAAAIFEQGFERAGIVAMGNRIAGANAAYAMLGGGIGGLSPAITGIAGGYSAVAGFKGSPGQTTTEMAAAIRAANAITAHHYDYQWGGGHIQSGSPTGGPGTGFDCSGAVSAILHAAGVQGGPMVAADYMSFGQPGAGGPNDATIYSSQGHVFMKMGSKYFGTSGSNPGGGADWFNNASTGGFTVRHVNLGGKMTAAPPGSPGWASLLSFGTGAGGSSSGLGGGASGTGTSNFGGAIVPGGVLGGFQSTLANMPGAQYHPLTPPLVTGDGTVAAITQGSLDEATQGADLRQLYEAGLINVETAAAAHAAHVPGFAKGGFAGGMPPPPVMVQKAGMVRLQDLTGLYPPTDKQLAAFRKQLAQYWGTLSGRKMLPARARFPNIAIQQKGLGGEHGRAARAYTLGRTIHVPWAAVPISLHRGDPWNNWERMGWIHEFAHTMQRDNLQNPYEVEGGATAWASQRGRQILQGMDENEGREGSYGKWADWVIKNRGWNWIDHKQFKYGRGGLVPNFASGGWVKTGATWDTGHGPQAGGAGEFAWNGGMSFAELLEAGVNAGKRPDATQLLGLPRDPHGYPGMSLGTHILARMPGKGSGFDIRKSDAGSGQPSTHFTIDLHEAIAHKLGWTPNQDIEIAKVGTGAGASSGKGGKPPKSIKPTLHKVKKFKSPKLPKLPSVPKPKNMPADIMTNYNHLVALDTTVTRLGDWQSYIDSLHGVTGDTQALVTLADGSQVVNWDGMKDPSTGQWDKGINARLKELGTQNDRAHQPYGSDASDTEIGINESVSDNLDAQVNLAANVNVRLSKWQAATNKIVGAETGELAFLKDALSDTFTVGKMPKAAWPLGPPKPHSSGGVGLTGGTSPKGTLNTANPDFNTSDFNAWINKYVAQYKRRVAEVAWWKKLKAKLTADKKERTTAIVKRYAGALLKVKNAKGTVNADGILDEMGRGLRDETMSHFRKISSKPPTGWVGSQVGWDAEVLREKNDLFWEVEGRGKALNIEAKKHGFKGHVSAKTAQSVLGHLKDAEGNQLDTIYKDRNIDLGNLISGDQTQSGVQKKYLSGLNTAITTEQTTDKANLASATDALSGLADYVDPLGGLTIAKLTMQNITIPGQLKEISDLTGTVVPKTSTSSTTSTDEFKTLLDQLALQRKGVGDWQSSVLRGRDYYAPYGGSFATGGMVPGPPGEPRTIIAHGGEYVQPQGAGTPVVYVNIDGKGVSLTDLIDTRVEHSTRRMSRQPALPGRAGRFG